MSTDHDWAAARAMAAALGSPARHVGRRTKADRRAEEAHANAERLRAEYEQAAPGPEAELARKSWENAKLIARIEANNARIDREERELKRDRANLRRLPATNAHVRDAIGVALWAWAVSR